MKLGQLPIFAAAALLVCGVSCSQPSSDGAAVLRFTAIPDDNATELQAKFEPVAAYLSESLGVDVSYIPTASYAASVEAFRNGDIQLAWFGGLTGVQARSQVSGAVAIAQGKVDPNYHSYFIAHIDAGFSAVDPTAASGQFPMALGGKSFTFGSPSSTSGRLMPEHFIRLNTGQSPTDFFGTEDAFSGSHDKTVALVAAGTFEAGAVSYKTYDRMVAEGKVDPAVCQVIWVSPNYPDYNFTAHPSLDGQFGEGFTKRLQSALVGMTDPALLSAVMRKEGLIAATNKDFEPVRELAEKLGFLR
ncbi:MAG: putative selenate ABC transporter substrate-binding protein [Planctomycetes bacterium]|nr:putative selenate ABC transporter substrate-binding protein [Planctomycetota bacterium]MBT4029169.1 putative selenate ABC transporter substrate-binding protein [Planctomycetota bacterium]MBT4559250.1 putative selenate ABC transporter substrate-binding protein [Planctomycetota bacterium]MBT5101232.1 putative selenate ABC transporter substrate-binding protein [Planctomycetota bacterium]MBT5119954.1 putative selenate ABC transporter substrate-binding protein [Planctomycetota bacterium]